MDTQIVAPDRRHTSPKIIPDEIFRSLVYDRAKTLLRLALHLERRAMGREALTRPLLGALQSEAAQTQELLDAYGARNNRRWHHLRKCVSAVKLFSDVSYKIRHILHFMRAYRLMEAEGDFPAETEKALFCTSDLTMLIATQLANTARSLRIPLPPTPLAVDQFTESIPEGILPHDLQARHSRSAEETVAHLATAFLNLAAESDLLGVELTGDPADYGELVPDPISEESLRQLEQKFHNLQSLYDTHVSDTDTETLDPSLPALRGHISVIFHLLEIGVLLTHYYERHIRAAGEETIHMQKLLVNPIVLLELLMDYVIAYAAHYLEAARALCREMLRRYAETGQVSLPVPRYRGFHVRPSTLIARIIRHYGSPVIMTIHRERYNAAAPLELFRANEKINAEKRCRLAAEVAAMRLPSAADSPEAMVDIARRVVLELAAQNKIIVYTHPLPLEELTPDPNESLPEFVADEIARLLALGKIDIRSDLAVTFEGDMRVLHDIRCLAENGYGEDDFGNNIPLPPELPYLRR